MTKNQPEREILIEIFYKLIPELDRANNFFRKQSIYFQNLFKKYNSSPNDIDRAKRYQKLIGELKKLSPKFGPNSTSEITKVLNSFRDSEKESLVLKHLNEEVGIAENIIAIVNAIEATYLQVKSQGEKDVNELPSKKADSVAQPLELSDQPKREHPKPAEPSITLLKTPETRREEIRGAGVTTGSVSREIAPENAKIMEIIVRLKAALKDPIYFDNKNNQEELVALIYYYCKLKSKFQHSEEDKVMLDLLEKYKPLDILKRYTKKYPESVSYDSLIKDVNQKLGADLDQLFGYEEEYIYYQQQNQEAIGYQVIGMTQLMSPEEISILYERYAKKLYKPTDYTVEAVQYIFAEAIRCNAGYSFLIKIPETEKNKEAERMIICAQYFNQFPVNYQSKEEMQNFIATSGISHPLLVQIMNEIINNLPNDIKVPNHRVSSRFRKAA